MAVVIRLQGLSVAAGTEDIRKFFAGLKIPDGGVHIIGGQLDEAFIIFSTDEDARRAMTRSGSCIKGSPIALVLSSKAEMQALLERSAKTVEPEQRNPYEENERRVRGPLGPEEGRPGARLGHQTDSVCDDDGFCVALRGLPFAVIEKDIFDFFGGLLIDDLVLLKNDKGMNNGKALLKFATREDARKGLQKNRHYIGSRYIEVAPATVDNWYEHCGRLPLGVNINVNFERDRSPIRNERIPQHHVRPQSSTLMAPGDEYCVLMDNLSFSVDKQDIKNLFQYARLEDDQILQLLDGEGRKTRSAFVLFRNQRDYCEALVDETRLFLNRQVHTRPISRENMMALLESHSVDVPSAGNAQLYREGPPSYTGDNFDSEKTCMFVRNLPFDVRKVEIMDFFHGFDITEDKVFVLLDHRGAGAGKAVVIFRSELEATRALSLDGQRFLGSEVLLKCITRSQVKELGIDVVGLQEPLPREERYSSRSSMASHRSDDLEYPDFRALRDDRNGASSHRSGQAEFPDFRMPRDDRNNEGPYRDAPVDFPDFRVPRGGRNNEAPYGFADAEYLDSRASHDSSAPMRNVQGLFGRGWEPDGPVGLRDRGNGFRGAPQRPLDVPTSVRLSNLPYQIGSEEIYDFFHGYQVMPGSLVRQTDQAGKPSGVATVVFESHSEAMVAVRELNGRPIGPRRIRLHHVKKTRVRP